MSLEQGPPTYGLEVHPCGPSHNSPMTMCCGPPDPVVRWVCSYYTDMDWHDGFKLNGHWSTFYQTLYIWYLRFYYFHLVDTSAGRLLVPVGIIHLVESAALILSWFIRYTFSLLVTLADLVYSVYSRVPDERFLRICLNGITHTCMVHRWNEENKPHRNKDVVAMYCGHVFFKIGVKGQDLKIGTNTPQVLKGSLLRQDCEEL